MGACFPELYHFEIPTTEVLKNEEESFMKTIENGMSILNDELSRIGDTAIFPTNVAYKLYDTYGFPLDLTEDILKNYGKGINSKEFERISQEHKEKSKNAWAGTGDSFTEKVWYDIKETLHDVEFLRGVEAVEATILAIIRDGEIVDTAEPSDEPIYIITDNTPFYAEAGGQVGDTGFILQTHNNVAEVIDTKKKIGIHYHKCIVKSGVIISKKPARLEVDSERRTASARNHTCAHMLQKSLRAILGDHVSQKGSLVTPERLRFDFIHSGTIDKQQAHMIEKMVNDNIEKGLIVHTEILPLEEAMSSGAIALFGEKYPEYVRVVTIGDDWSKELCGGEHVYNTMQIKWFKILGISSIGSGIKRIEAITGNQIITHLEAEIEKLSEKIAIQQASIKNLSSKAKEICSIQESDINEEIFDNGVKFIIISLKNIEHKEVMNFIDKQKTNDCTKVVLAVNEIKDRCSLFLYTNL
jgi:alanyl-tRNA synthetase